jgi:hypothetical protein
MLEVVHGGGESSATSAAVGSSLLDEIARDGARQMLGAALQAEVAAYIETHRDQRDQVEENGYPRAARNGDHEPQEVTSAAGAGPVRQPRANDRASTRPLGNVSGSPRRSCPRGARRSPK